MRYYAAMSGKVLVRMPPALHEQLSRLAEEQGVSLNQLVVSLLAGGVGFTLTA
jgi:predicted HicB family RNase H-like nuclease